MSMLLKIFCILLLIVLHIFLPERTRVCLQFSRVVQSHEVPASDVSYPRTSLSPTNRFWPRAPSVQKHQAQGYFSVWEACRESCAEFIYSAESTLSIFIFKSHYICVCANIFLFLKTWSSLPFQLLIWDNVL